MIEFHCPHCNRRIRIHDNSNAGRKGECKGCGRRIRIPKQSEPTQHRPTDAETAMKQALFGRYQKHEDRRISDNHDLKMKMAYKALDIPQDEDGMKVENNSRTVTNTGMNPWAVVGLVAAAALAKPVADKLSGPAPSSVSTPATIPANIHPDTLRKIISESFEVIHVDENGNPVPAERINDKGEVIPEAPVTIKRVEQ